MDILGIFPGKVGKIAIPSAEARYHEWLKFRRQMGTFE